MLWPGAGAPDAVPLRPRVERRRDGVWTITGTDAPGLCVQGTALHDAFSQVRAAMRDLGSLRVLMPSPS